MDFHGTNQRDTFEVWQDDVVDAMSDVLGIRKEKRRKVV